MDTAITKDRLQKAKDALLYTLHAAERELRPIDVKRLEKIVATTEALQASWHTKYPPYAMSILITPRR